MADTNFVQLWSTTFSWLPGNEIDINVLLRLSSNSHWSSSICHLPQFLPLTLSSDIHLDPNQPAITFTSLNGWIMIERGHFCNWPRWQLSVHWTSFPLWKHFIIAFTSFKPQILHQFHSVFYCNFLPYSITSFLSNIKAHSHNALLWVPGCHGNISNNIPSPFLGIQMGSQSFWQVLIWASCLCVLTTLRASLLWACMPQQTCIWKHLPLRSRCNNLIIT